LLDIELFPNGVLFEGCRPFNDLAFQDFFIYLFFLLIFLRELSNVSNTIRVAAKATFYVRVLL